MLIANYQYPGDPPAYMAVMTAGRFVSLYRPPAAEHLEVICDTCNADGSDQIVAVLLELSGEARWAYCMRCFIPKMEHCSDWRAVDWRAPLA